MGKRFERTQAVLALVLLYQLSQPAYASASVFNWLMQPLASQTMMVVNEGVNDSEEETDTGRSIIKEEPLTKISLSREEDRKEEVLQDPVLVLEGEASYYSWDGCLGCHPQRIMANGKTLDDNALTMAIGADKKYLLGRQAKVTNLLSGKSAIVRITDTGGFYKAKYNYRVADLTIGTKKAIGMEGGLAYVKIEVF